MQSKKLVLVEYDVLPEAFCKVLEAKELLASDKATNYSQACKQVDLSRSAFYKYKDKISLYEGQNQSAIMTLHMRLSDRAGVLGSVLKVLSSHDVNVLTVNQNIPVDRVAVVTMSCAVQNISISKEEMVSSIGDIDGVLRIKEI